MEELAELRKKIKKKEEVLKGDMPDKEWLKEFQEYTALIDKETAILAEENKRKNKRM